MDIIKVSKQINSLGHRVTSTFSRGFWTNPSNYGDYGRTPYIYLKTYTTKNFFLGSLPLEIKDSQFSYYQDFPKLSQQLLRNLFANIGVEYVPEIALYQLETKKTPFEVFEKFCTTFTKSSIQIDANEINKVILKLKEMDELRKVYPLNSRPIYSSLSYLNFNRASKLIEQMKEAIEMLKINDNEEEKKRIMMEWNIM